MNLILFLVLLFVVAVVATAFWTFVQIVQPLKGWLMFGIIIIGILIALSVSGAIGTLKV